MIDMHTDAPSDADRGSFLINGHQPLLGIHLSTTSSSFTT